MSGASSANFKVDPDVIRELHTRRLELEGERPRFGLFLFDCVDAETIRNTLTRIPEALDEWIEVVVVMLDLPGQAGLAGSMHPRTGRSFDLRVHHPPRTSSFGAARKEAFESAHREGLDHVIVMRADGLHPPERLPELVLEALRRPRELVLATRGGEAGPSGATLLHRAMTAAQNRILGLELSDYHTSFRVYPCDALDRIPYQLDSDGTPFDAEIIIQFRTLGVPIRELPALGGRRGDGSGNDSLQHGLGACAAAIGSRLHQIHITRDGRYLVDHYIHYTLKLSDTSSHMQIVSAIRPGSLALDLGCSQGLLAEPLLEKNVRVVGVDAGPGRRLADALAEYHQGDLEEPLEIPHEREFDYVICADVIEHLRNRAQLLRSARRYLKEDGRLIISTGNVALWFYRLSLLVGRFEYGPRGVLDETHVRLFTGTTFRREVEKAGFRILKQRVTALPFEVVFQSTGRSPTLRRLASAYHALARLWPSMFAYQYVLEAEITTLDAESTKPGANTP
ncbi:MAG: methyltransferase domain-containing protein [Deltaproteobacteria bacterium]|nr:methyltransferase domain-containing protein [Deltaproteobacteria bacterium]